jgi:hypothetical protein
MMPPITTVASGRCTSAPVLTAKAIGTNPKEATNAVISTGRKRVNAPCRTASSRDKPSVYSFLIKVIMTRPLSTATPERAIKPTPAEIERGIFRSQSATIPPVKAKGTPVKTSRPSLKLPKVLYRKRKMSSRAIGTTMVRRFAASIISSNCPPQWTQ